MSKRVIKNHSVAFEQENVVVIENVVEVDENIPSATSMPSRNGLDLPNFDVSQAQNDEEKEEDARQNARAIMENATKQAGEVLETARAEAHRITQAARKEAEEQRGIIMVQAEQKGFDQGYEKGFEEGNAAAQSIINNAKAMRQQTEDERKAAIDGLEPQMMQIVLNIVDKIVQTNVRNNPTVMLNLIKQGFAEASYTGEVTLRVSKDDYDYVINNKDTILEYVEGGASLEIIKDHSLNAKDCLIETPFGVVDSSLTMQLDEIKQDLAQLL